MSRGGIVEMKKERYTPLKDEEKILFATFWLPAVLLRVAFIHGTGAFSQYGWEVTAFFAGTVSSFVLLVMGTLLAILAARAKQWFRCIILTLAASIAGFPGALWLMDQLV
jgi:phosphoglycerol transferase MdoB-like AlkP superfamily enzyme